MSTSLLRNTLEPTHLYIMLNSRWIVNHFPGSFTWQIDEKMLDRSFISKHARTGIERNFIISRGNDGGRWNISRWVHVDGNAFFGGVGRAAEEEAARNRSNVVIIFGGEHSVFTTEYMKSESVFVTGLEHRQPRGACARARRDGSSYSPLVENRRWKTLWRAYSSRMAAHVRIYTHTVAYCAVCFSTPFYKIGKRIREYLPQ